MKFDFLAPGFVDHPNTKFYIMKKMIISILMLGSVYATKAQTTKRDDSMNANDFKADSVKRGDNIYIGENHAAKPDTTTKHKTSPVKKTVGAKPKHTGSTGRIE